MRMPDANPAVNLPESPSRLRVLGIDPGLQLTGYAVVEIRPKQANLEPKLLEAGVIRLKRQLSVDERLIQLYDDLASIVQQFEPNCMAVEKLYAHYKHPTTAIVMGHARGVILLCARQNGMQVCDMPSTEVKKSITGYGHASKLQIQRAIQHQCSLPELPSPPDVADAIAIALCQARRFLLGH